MQRRRLSHASAESGREFPVIDGFQGLIYASRQEQQFCAAAKIKNVFAFFGVITP
jgi:hypothetical protein